MTGVYRLQSPTAVSFLDFIFIYLFFFLLLSIADETTSTRLSLASWLSAYDSSRVGNEPPIHSLVQPFSPAFDVNAFSLLFFSFLKIK